MTATIDPLTEFYGDPIHVYTQADAIRDGALIVPDAALVKEAGIRWPLLMTAAAHADTVTWTEADEKRKVVTGQDETGRLWDVLNLARIALHAYSRKHSTATPGDRIPFQLFRVPREGRGTRARKVVLHAVVGSQDDGAPCFVIMLPSED